MDPTIRETGIWKTTVVQLACCASVYECPEVGDYVERALNRGSWRPTIEYFHAVDAEGASGDRIELACRLWTGFETPQDHRAAFEQLLAVCATSVRDTRNGARFRPTQARARALLAWMLWCTVDLEAADSAFTAAKHEPRDGDNEREAPPELRRALATLHRAASFAEEAIALGLPSFACMQVAVAHAAARRRFPAACAPDARDAFPALAAFHDRLALAPIEAWMPFATGKRPVRAAAVRVCAGRGCDIQETPAWPFSLCCGGLCPAERKPWYCSRACSWSGWQDHADDCRSDEPVSGKGKGREERASSEDDAERARKGMALSLEQREADDLKSEACFTAITKQTQSIRAFRNFDTEVKESIQEYMASAFRIENMKNRAMVQPMLKYWP